MNVQELTITIERPLGSVGSADASDGVSTKIDNSAIMSRHVNSQLQKIDSLCSALANAIEQTGNIQKQIISESQQKVGELALEIAELILNDKISKQDYDIEKILSNKVDKLQDKNNIEIDINPCDHQTCQNIIQKNAGSSLATIKLNPDTSVPAAQCRIKTTHGIIESFFKEQLEKIAITINNSSRE